MKSSEALGISLSAGSHVLISGGGGAVAVAPYSVVKKVRKVSVTLAPNNRDCGSAFLTLLDKVWGIHRKLKQSQGISEEISKESSLVEMQALIAEYEKATAFDPGVIARSSSSEEEKTAFLQTRAVRVMPLCAAPGWAGLSESIVVFQPYSCRTETGTSRFPLCSIDRMGRRTCNLEDLALEIYYRDNPNSLFLRFLSTNDRDAFAAAVQHRAGLAPPPPLRHWTNEWIAHRLSNYEYLMRINEAAGRSFNDLTQYPVFPWVLSDYRSPSLDLSDPGIFRDLSKPVAALSPSRVRQAREMYNALLSSGGADPPYMYGSHYSSPGTTVFYLVRACPQLMLNLQNGRFDAPDRLFYSIAGAWESVTRWNSDVKELIPEFYTPGSSAFLRNSAGAQFGRRSDGVAVEDVELPPWAIDTEDFLKKMSDALEAPQVSMKLHKWIDLLFGAKSRGRQAVMTDNVFHFMTYDDIACRMLSGEVDPIVRKSYEAQVQEYGRTPRQLFKNKHPKRKGPPKLPRLLQACVCSIEEESPRLTVRRQRPLLSEGDG